MPSVDDWEPTEEELDVWEEWFLLVLRIVRKAKESQDSLSEPTEPIPAILRKAD